MQTSTMPTQSAVCAKPEEPTLHERTIQLVRDRPRSLELKDIAGACDVTVHWLEKLIGKGILEPGVNKVERVYRYLTNYKAK